MKVRAGVVALAATAVALLAGAAPATASTGPAFGRHMASCAQEGMLSGAHNPGMHRGVSGWDRSSC